MALDRSFLDLVLRNRLSWELRDWLSHTLIPDEHFYSTLTTVRVEHKIDGDMKLLVRRKIVHSGSHTLFLQ